MGGIIVIRGKITSERVDADDEYQYHEAHLTLRIPNTATITAEAKAFKIARKELVKFYETLEQKLSAVDFNEAD